MNTRILQISLLAILFMLSGEMHAQNAKKVHKQGQKFMKSAQYEQAIEQFTEAIKFDSVFADAYSDRAFCYEKLEKIQEAANDYIMASELLPKEVNNFFQAGRLLHMLKKYEEAIDLLNTATNLDKKHIEAYQVKIKSLLELERYADALKESEAALELKKTDYNYFIHGFISTQLGSYDIAENDFRKAIKLNSEYEEAYNGLANVLYLLNKFDEAISTCDKVIEINPKNREAFLIRSKIHHKKADYVSAINDLTNIISTINPDDIEVYNQRGIYYQEFNQHGNAIIDFCKVISLDETYFMAYYHRAISYEATNDIQNAVKDYESFRKYVQSSDEQMRNLLQKAKEKIYVLNKESNKPEIVIDSPVLNEEGEIEIKQDQKKITIKGSINDESDISFLTINEQKYKFTENSDNKKFEIEIDVSELEKINFTTADIYHNTTKIAFLLKRTEINQPVIHLISPYASDNGEIYLDQNDPTLFIEGKITDESKIKSILIEGATASYKIDDLNPSFTASIEIANKTTISIKATDIYGNTKEQKYTINREGANLFADNPMGKTWVIFIENSNYQNFASLDGPSKDVSIMRAALANYKIHNIIHKKDLTKAQLERFFAIELRDMVRTNGVNSIIVWYAGHGKFIHETGYWIPVNAKRDDEFTYFNINNLKASMQSYSKFITHTLVITDACESGPSFYMAMRSDPKERDCGDWQATKFKSSQVFTSAGHELASDNSQFTKTFANSLKYNPNDCIPIENIVIKVTEAVSETGLQKPKFGKIAGLEDEDGTFFFIKK